MKTWRKQSYENLATIFMMVAMFLNPLGFDILFYSVLQSTNSYWITTLTFYLGAAFFAGLYFYFRKKAKQHVN